MIVAVVAVGMMQPPVDQEVDMIAVRHGLVSAARAVRMSWIAVGGRSVSARMRSIDVDHVLVDVSFVEVMEMAFVQVVDVVVVSNRSVAAAISVSVRMLALMNGMTHAANIHLAHAEFNQAIPNYLPRRSS